MKKYEEIQFNGELAALTGKVETTCCINNTKIIKYEFVIVYPAIVKWAHIHEFKRTGYYLQSDRIEADFILPHNNNQEAPLWGLRLSW